MPSPPRRLKTIHTTVWMCSLRHSKNWITFRHILLRPRFDREMKVITLGALRKTVGRLYAKVAKEKEKGLEHRRRWSDNPSVAMAMEDHTAKSSGQMPNITSCTISSPIGTTDHDKKGLDLDANKEFRMELPYAPKRQFHPTIAKELIGAVLQQKLVGVVYNPDLAPTLVREITEDVKKGLKDMELENYKLVVQAVIGEQRGQGFQMSCRCFWDPNTDNYAHDSFVNESVFCFAGAFALYLY